MPADKDAIDMAVGAAKTVLLFTRALVSVMTISSRGCAVQETCIWEVCEIKRSDTLSIIGKRCLTTHYL